MPYYDVEGEAVVAISVKADNEDDALNQWNKFSEELVVSDYMITGRASQFYARVTGKPDIVRSD